MKFESSIYGTAMRSGFLVPTAHRGMGGVCPDPVRRRLVDGSAAATSTTGLPSSAPPIT